MDKQINYTVGNFDQTTGQSNCEGWGDIKKSQPIPASWEDQSWGNDTCPSFYHNGLKIWIESEVEDDREVLCSRYTVFSVNQDNEIQEDGAEGGRQYDDFAEVVEYVDAYNDHWACQRSLVNLPDTLKDCRLLDNGESLSPEDFIDRRSVRKAINKLNKMIAEDWTPSVVQEALVDSPAFYVDERYDDRMCITEPVLCFCIQNCGDEVDLVDGHCNPYIDDDFTQDSLETLADDLNSALGYYWDRLNELFRINMRVQKHGFAGSGLTDRETRIWMSKS